MAKKRITALEENIKLGVNSRLDQEYLVLKLCNSLARKIILALLLIGCSILFGERVSKLSTISSDGLFGGKLVLGPTFYYTALVTFLVIALIVFILVIGYKNKIKKSQCETKKLYRFYNFFDFVSFCFMTIITFSFAIMFIFTPCRVAGDSMNNTFKNGDRLIVWHLAYEPKRDDAVIIDVTREHYGYYEDTFFIKRIVGCPGDKVRYEKVDEMYGSLYINDHLEATIFFYEFEVMSGLDNVVLNNEFIIPEKRYMVFGDNRLNSTDSRRLGLVFEEDILGKVLIRIYPFSQIGTPKKDVLE